MKPTAREVDQSAQLNEAASMARQIEAVLEAAGRMAVCDAGDPDFQRMHWLYDLALNLSGELLIVLENGDASASR